MGIRPVKSTQAITRAQLAKILDPSHVFYRVAVDDVLRNGELADIRVLLKGAKDVKAKYGNLDGLIKQLEAAAKKAQ